MPRQTCRSSTATGAKLANNYGPTTKAAKVESVCASDSEEDDAEVSSILGNMPMPLMASTAKRPTVSSSASSLQHGGHHHRGQDHGHFMHSQSHSHAHQTHHQQLSCSSEQSQSGHHQSAQAQQRKKPLNPTGGGACSSAMSMSSSSSALGMGGRKAAPLSPLTSHGLSSQSQASTVALNNNDFEEDYTSGIHVNQMLSKLGADLQHRVRAKRQRLDEYFKNVKAAPGATLSSRQRHIEQRNKLVDELRADTVKLTERLDNIIQVQASNQEKHTKMMHSLTRGSEQVRAAISDCVKTQASLYENFTTELKKLEDQQDETTKELMERCESTVLDLQNKIASEQMKSETESLFKLKFI